MSAEVTEPTVVRWIPTEHRYPGLQPGWWHDLRGSERTACGLTLQPWTNPGVMVDLRIGWRGGGLWVPVREASAPDGEQRCARCTAELSKEVGFGER